MIENLSLGHIPDLLETPNSRNNSTGSQNKDNGENCDSITELPSTSLQLQHLVKGRPKRVKTRAPSRPLVTEMSSMSSHAIGEGIEAFFRPGSVTPTTLTPLVSPTSDECSSLSFVDSPTMSRDDHNGKNCFTSEETTPILEERKPIKLERNSPLLKGVSWTPRSRSTDNLEKYSPLIGRKSPLIKKQMTDTSSNDTSSTLTSNTINNNDCNPSRLHPPTQNETKTRSPSNESIKSFENIENNIIKIGNGMKTPLLPPKPRPWSVAGNEGKCDFTVDSSKTTPEALDGNDVVLIDGQSGGSIVGITPAALSSSIVGISPGLLENFASALS